MNGSNGDMLDLVRRADPMPAGSAAGWSSTEQGRGVEQQVRLRLEFDETPARPQRRRRRTFLLLAATLALVVATGALVVASRKTDAATVWCAEGPELSNLLAVPKDQDPTSWCAQMWPEFYGLVAPSLVACYLPEGGVVALPQGEYPSATEACGALGGSPAE